MSQGRLDRVPLATLEARLASYQQNGIDVSNCVLPKNPLAMMDLSSKLLTSTMTITHIGFMYGLFTYIWLICMLKRRYVHTPATWQPFGMLGSGSTLISQEKDHSGQLVGGLGPSPRGKPPSNNPFDKGIQSESKPHTQLSQETLKKNQRRL